MVIRLLAVLFWASPLVARPGTETLVVFPFENRSSHPEINWMSESFPEIFRSRLGSAGRSVLTREERAQGLELVELPPQAVLTLASQLKVAQAVGADWAVVGSFRGEGNVLSAQARLLDVAALKLSPPLKEKGKLSDFIELQTRLAWQVLRELDPNFPVNQNDFGQRFPALRLDAFENLMRGLISSDPEVRLRYFMQAEQLNPADYRAAFELGRLHFQQKSYEDSIRWLKKFPPEEEWYWEAHFLLGLDYYFLGENLHAEKEFRGLATQLGVPEAYNNLGVIEAARRQPRQALSNFLVAHQAAPEDPDFAFNVAAAYWQMEDYVKAAEYLAKCRQRRDDDAEAQALLASLQSEARKQAGNPKDQPARVALAGGRETNAAERSFAPQERIKKEYPPGTFRPRARGSGPALSGVVPGRGGQEPAGQRSVPRADF